MTDGSSDDGIIKSILEGNRQAFRLLVDRYSNAVFRFCRMRLGNDDEAEDAVQEIFIRVFKSLGSFKEGRSFPAWLFTIAANRVKSRYRVRTKDAVLTRTLEREVYTVKSPDAEAEALDSLAVEQLRRAMGKLPQSVRESLELFYFSGLSVGDASLVLGIGTEAFKSRLFRARKSLGAIMDDSMQPGRKMEGI